MFQAERTAMKVTIMKRQRGISLVEIMIALVLSLFLSAGVIQVYLASKQSYRAQEGYSRLQENGRYALETMTRFIRLAGYKSYGASSMPDDTAVFVAAAGSFAAGQVVTGSDGGGTASDSVTVRYQDDSQMGDCYAQTGDNLIHVVTFDVLNNNLRCTGNAGTESILDGVENLQLLYGIDTDAPTDGYANQYRDAGAVTAAGQWGAVVSVRIGLLLNTVEGVSGVADTAAFNLLGANIAAPGAADPARFMRRHPSTATINVRNRTP
jgi:type IV pilus assembly protein PilW